MNFFEQPLEISKREGANLMIKILLITGGVLNLILTLFHVFLGYQISLIDNIVDPEKLIVR